MTDLASVERILDWDDVLDDSNYYEILGILPIADEEAVKEAFRDFALAFHPDLHDDAEADLRAKVLRIFQRGAEGYRVLSHPELRLRYDMVLEKGQLRLDAKQVPKAPAVNAPARPLHDLCRTTGGKTAAKKAARLIEEGDLHGARESLKQALSFEGGANVALRDRLDALEVALFAMGG